MNYNDPKSGRGYRWPLATHPGGVSDEAKVREALASEIKRDQSQRRAAEIFGPIWDKTDATFQAAGHMPPPRPMTGPMSAGGPSMAFPPMPMGNAGDTSDEPAGGPAADPGEDDDPQGMVEHANPAAMAPTDVRALQAPRGLEHLDQNKLAVIADALQREAGNQGGPLTYSGELKDQPWFARHIQGSKLQSQISPEQRAQFGKLDQLPTIQHVGDRQNPAGWNSYQAYMGSPERVQAREDATAARLKAVKDAGAFRQAQIDNSPHRQQAMRQAAFNANPRLATMQALRDISGPGGGGGFGPAQAFAMANAGMGEFVPAMANAAVAQAQHADANRLAQGQLDLQGRIVGLQEDAAHAGQPKDWSKRTPFDQSVIARQFKERYHDSRDIFGRNQMKSHAAKQEALLHNLRPEELIAIAKRAEGGVLPVAEAQAPTRNDPGAAIDVSLVDFLKKLGTRMPFMPLLKGSG
jgi:hypothetical protein